MNLKEKAVDISRRMVELEQLEPKGYVFAWHLDFGETKLSAWKIADNEDICFQHDPMKFEIEKDKIYVLQKGKYSQEECENVIRILNKEISKRGQK